MAYTVFLSPELPSVLMPVRDAFLSEASTLAADSLRRVEEIRLHVEPYLRRSGWSVGSGVRSRTGVAISRPHGAPVRADAASLAAGAALWIETGRSWANNGFLEHLVEAASCPAISHLALAVRTTYDRSAAYEKVVDYLDPVFKSGRIGLPFESVLVLGF